MAQLSSVPHLLPRIRGLTVLDQIGNGAGSLVFKARAEHTGELVAIKSVTRRVVLEIQGHAPMPEYGGDISKLLRMYLAQVRNEWRLGHRMKNESGGHLGIPHMHRLVTRYGPWGVRGRHLLMEFVEGRNLRIRHNYTLPEVVDIYHRAADILRFLHRHDVVHADMKPHHVIVGPRGTVHLLDLGLACHRHGHVAQLVGSPRYMAPEQLVGAGVDERTDVFGLGATMFWVLTERAIRSTVDNPSTPGLLDLQTQSYERTVREYNPDVPPALEEIILQSCSPSRRARPPLPEVIARLERLSRTL